MASIKERGNKFCVIYHYKDSDGNRRQKWETYATRLEALERKKEVEYRGRKGIIAIPKCSTLKQLLKEYVALYGKDAWAVTTYEKNVAMINNYIVPLIGNTKLSDISIRFIEKYYQTLLTTPAVINPVLGHSTNEYVGPSVIRDVHKILRSCFWQAVKWEMMESNPCEHATVPKYKMKKREIWTADTLMYALEVCEDEFLKLSLNLAFSGSLRLGELLGLTWDCVDISQSAIEENRAYIYINKELQRVSKSAIKDLDGKDILLVFPAMTEQCKTVRVLKTPKTESSIRKIFLPRSVATMLADWKQKQDENKELLGNIYHDYGIVMATSYGFPSSGCYVRKCFKKLIEEHNLPPVVFHSLRHTSVTYKLKLNGGDIKAVQGDSGHAQVNMVTDVYSHIIDEDRRKNAELFENAFYEKKNLHPHLHEPEPDGGTSGGRTLTVPEGVDAELLAKVLGNPETMALLTALAKSMQ